MVDIHNHIIYGLDDGAKTIEDTMEMLEYAYNEGIREMIATPHYYRSRYDYSLEQLEEHFRKIEEEIEARRLDMKIYMGNEAYLDDALVEALDSGKCRTMNGSRYVLVELFDYLPHHSMINMLFQIIGKGYTPIIAHCERLVGSKDDYQLLNEFRDIGCLLQVNAKSLLKKDRFLFRRWLMKKIKDGTIQFVCTDTHNVTTRKPDIKKAYNFVKRKVGKEIADRVFETNAKKVVLDEDI